MGNRYKSGLRRKEREAAGQVSADEAARVHRSTCRALGLDPNEVSPSDLAEKTADSLTAEALLHKHELNRIGATHRRDAPKNPRWNLTDGYLEKRTPDSD